MCYRPVKDVGVSLVMPGQPLVEASSCRILWNETQSSQQSELPARLLKMEAAENPPPKKRRGVVTERLAAALNSPLPSDKPEERGRGVVSPGHSVCLAVNASLGVPGQGIILVVTWREEVGGRVMAEEFAQVKVDIDLFCGGGSIDQRCLDLWNGKVCTFIHYLEREMISSMYSVVCDRKSFNVDWSGVHES